MTTTDITDIERRIDEAQARADLAAEAYEKVKHLAYSDDGEDRSQASQARSRMQAAGHGVDLLVNERRYALRGRVVAVEREAAIVAANQAHADAEREAANDLSLLGVRLAESAAKVARTSAAAVKALTQMFDASKAHDDLVRGIAKDLRARGLVLEDEKLGLSWDVGAFGNDILKIGGKTWLPLATGPMFMRAAWGAARARFGGQHFLTQRLDRWSGVSMLDTRPDELLKDAPLPPPYQPPAAQTWKRADFSVRAEVIPSRDVGGSDQGNYFDAKGKRIG